MRKSLEKLIDRLVDLYEIIRKYYYHPDFRGSYSIKTVLPVLVGGNDYEELEINNGGDASAVFVYMCRGRYSDEEVVRLREKLLEYCKLDTLAMVRLEEGLRGKLSIGS